jgi:hypothetical protein
VTRRAPALRFASIALAAACARVDGAQDGPQGGPQDAIVADEPKDPPASTPWHREPVLEKRVGKNVAVYNHADATLNLAPIVDGLQREHDFLAKYTGGAPRWVLVHVGAHYECGFSIKAGPDPEMFLQAPSIFDTSANYAHEMMHCFVFDLCGDAGGAIPHWFNESLSDMAWFDSEIDLWQRRKESWLDAFDRVDYRSYELLQLRRKYGGGFFPKVCAAMRKQADACRRVFSAATRLDVRNDFILDLLTQAAGEDVRPLFKEWGFDPRTRERQRGY